jgi:hypothetical protein
MSAHCVQPPADLSSLPDPPVPAGLDLRHFDCMHLNTKRLLDADIWDDCSGDEIAAALRLWAWAWRQVPCSSLPNDAKKVAKMAGYEGRPARWKNIKTGALRGFHLASDGRLYHPVIAETALKAANKSKAGKRGSEVRWQDSKRLKSQQTGDATAHSSGDGKANGKRDDTLYSSRTGRSDGKPHAEKGREYSSPLPPSLGAAAGSGSLDAPPDRPATASPSADPEFVEVTIESGAKLRITRNGQVDEVWAPLDCPETAMTRKQALELRARALAARTSPAVRNRVEGDVEAPADQC